VTHTEDVEGGEDDGLDEQVEQALHPLRRTYEFQNLSNSHGRFGSVKRDIPPRDYDGRFDGDSRDDGEGAGSVGGKRVRLGDGGGGDGEDDDVETQVDDLGDVAVLDAEDELAGSDDGEYNLPPTWAHDDTNPSAPYHTDSFGVLPELYSKQTTQTATANATTYASMQQLTLRSSVLINS
jgi:hypothetical protein